MSQTSKTGNFHEMIAEFAKKIFCKSGLLKVILWAKNVFGP